jgi:hypothetical protein
MDKYNSYPYFRLCQIKGGNMMLDGSLLAWVEPCGTDKYVGAFVGEGAYQSGSAPSGGRPPAVQHCATEAEARQWIEAEAAAFGLPIKWVQPR